MRILLIKPAGKRELTIYASGNVHVEPLGLEYVAAVSNEAGHSVKVIQQNEASEDRLLEQVFMYNPELVGFSCMTYNYSNSLHLAKRIKSRSPGIYTVFGGYHPTSMPEIVREGSIDFVVIGEGEYSFLSLVEVLSSGGRISEVQGIAYFDKQVRTTYQERIEDLDNLPLPLRDTEAIGRFRTSSLHFPPSRTRGATVHVIYSRGCPRASCSYCQSGRLWGKRAIGRSPENTVEEMAMLKTQFGIKHFFFADLAFNHSRDRIYALCREIKRQNLGIYWFCQCRASSDLDEDILETMRDAGCMKINFGVEACSDSSLQKLGREQYLEEIEHVIRVTSSLGIIVKAYLMIGYPWDDRDSLENVAKIVRSLHIDELRITFLTPFPNTPLFEKCEREGLLLTEDFDRYTTDEPIIEIESMTPEDLIEARKQIARAFYTSKEYERRCKEKIAKFPYLKESFDGFREVLKSEGVFG